MNKLSLLLHRLAERYYRYSNNYRLDVLQHNLGFCDKTAVFKLPDVCPCPEKIFLYENTNVYEHSKFIISPKGEKGRFIMRRNSGSAQGLTVVTGNHQREIGVLVKNLIATRKVDEDKDVIVEEDVWIGANVTLLAGVKLGRGSTIAAGSVCVKNIPPYAIAMGNPARVIGFNYTPEEIVKHERTLYPESERLPIDKLERNYQKYYLDRLDEISLLIN